MPEAAINTKRVTGRRALRFESLNSIDGDVCSMAAWPGGARLLGNWSAGQNLAHVAIVMTYSIDGFPARMNGLMRLLLRLLIKRRILTRPMTPGFRAPKRAATAPAATSFEEGAALLREAVARLKTERKRSDSPFLGHLSNAEWEQLHCRRAELHLSFIVPAE